MELPDLEKSYEQLTHFAETQLTHREIDIIACIMRGRTARKSIALVLSISYRTVETHIHNILSKINASSWEFIREKVETLNLSLLFYHHYSLLLFERELLKTFLEIPIQNIAIKVYFLETQDILDLQSKLKSTLEYLCSKKVFIQTESVTIITLQTALGISTSNQESSKSKRENTILIADISALSQLTNLQNSIEVFAYSKENDVYDFILFFLERIIADKTKLESLHTSLQKIRQYHVQDNLAFVSKFDFSTQFIKQHRVILIFSICVILCTLLITFVKYFLDSAEPLRGALILPPKEHLLSRNDSIETISNILNKFRDDDHISIATIIGEGGAGKTTIARMITKKQNGIVWELPASNKAELDGSFIDFAFHLAKDPTDREQLNFIVKNSPFSDKNRLILNFVRDKLKHASEWTLLFDNVSSYENIEKYLPVYKDEWGNGRVIITTRNRLLSVGKQIYIDELTCQEAKTLLSQILSNTPQKSLSFNNADLDGLLTHIAHFPLDIVTAGLYIKHTGISIDEYLERLKHQGSNKAHLELLKQNDGYKDTRKDIVSLSISQIIQEYPSCICLLFAISATDPVNIPEKLLVSVQDNRDLLNSILLRLQQLSLIKKAEHLINEGVFSIHPSTQEILRKYLIHSYGHTAPKLYIQKIVDAIELYTTWVIECEKHTSMNFWLPTFESLLENTLISEKEHTLLRSLKAQLLIGLFHHHQLDIVPNLENHLKISQSSSSCNIKRRAHALSSLGEMHRYRGEKGHGIKEYLKGINFLEESIKCFSKINDRASLSYALALSRLGNLHRTLGNYSKAEMLIDSSQKIYESQTHFFEEVTHISENKGQLLKDQGHYLKALTVLNDCKQTKIKHSKHPMSIAWTESFIGNIYVDFGCYKRAQEQLNHALKVFEEHFPGKNPLRAWALANLGAAYVPTNINTSRRYLEESLEIYERLACTHQVIYKTILPNLVRVYLLSGELEKAKKYLSRCSKSMEDHYGTNHLRMAEIHCLRGWIYLEENSMPAGEEEFFKAWKLLEQAQHGDAYFPLEKLHDIYSLRAQTTQQKNLVDAYQRTAKDNITRAFSIIRKSFPQDSEHFKRINKKYKKAQNYK